MKYDPKRDDGCIQAERSTNDSEDELQDEETGPFPIPYTKFTNPTIRDQLRTLRTTLEQFYLISHKIRNP
jgi:hypothetical protein